MGIKMAYTYKVTEMTPTTLVMGTDQGPFPMETIYEWSKIDNQNTKMTLRNRGFPTGFSKLLSPFMSMMMKKNMKNDLKLLKSILEEGAKSIVK